MGKPLTGRTILGIFVAGFGIVFAVNFYMASLAVGGFSGVVVKNSYVASQEFNGWLEQAEKQAELGWSAEVTKAAAGHFSVSTKGVPKGAAVSATARRPLGQPETVDVEFTLGASGDYVSKRPLADGRWIVRLVITDGVSRWIEELHVS